MKNSVFLFLAMFVFSEASLSMTLQDFLVEVERNNKSAQALSISKDAVEQGRIAGDLELVPVFTADAGYIIDKNPFGSFAFFGATESKTNSYSLGLAKKFATGTGLSFTANTYEVENSGLSDSSRFKKFGVGNLGLGISQSLWKDFLGNSTELRWARQQASTKASQGIFDLQKVQILVAAEAAYWGHLYAIEGLKISKASLARAKRIMSWTERRVRDGISDRADSLQAQALVAARQLQLVSAEDELAASRRALRDFLELSEDQSLPEMTGDISRSRSLNPAGNGKGSKIVAITAYLGSLEAKAKYFEMKEAEDKLRPDLILSGSYNTNAFTTSMSEATQNWTQTDKPTSKVGIKFIYPFDFSPKEAAREAARKGALAAQLQSERKMLESDSSWLELNRRYGEMNKRIEAASEISRLQMAAASAQAELFNKGRAVTANVITAEEDAGNAELNLTKLKVEQRKMEAQGRFYTVIEE